MTEDLIALTKELGKEDATFKSAEKNKKKLRQRFFDAITAQKKVESLAQKTVAVAHPSSRKAAEERVAKYNPGWRVIDAKSTKKEWRILIEEDPEFLPFSFVNPEDRKVYQRQIVFGGPLLDDERMREEDPELWEKITYVPEPERKVKSPAEWDTDIIAAVTEYFYEGPPQVKLPAPRDAKDDELE